MPTDTTITRYGSTGANQGFAIVVRPDGPWVRYEDHQRALTTAHAALANLPGHTCHVSGDDCGGCEYARERDARIAAAHAARDADAARIDGMNRAINGLIEQLDAALRERDEARAEAAKLKDDSHNDYLDRWYPDRSLNNERVPEW